MRPYARLIVPELQEFLRDSDTKLVQAAVEELLPSDLADVCGQLAPPEAAALLTTLPLEDATETLACLEPEQQAEMVERVSRTRLVHMLDAMNPDDRADAMKQLPPATVELLMPLLAQAERNDLKKLLAYPEETAGALMTTDITYNNGVRHEG